MKKFDHLKGVYPSDGQTCTPEEYGGTGEKDSMPGAMGSKASEGGDHDHSAIDQFGQSRGWPKTSEKPDNVTGAIESDEPTKGENAGPPVPAQHAGPPARTTNVGVEGVHHVSSRRPNATAFERPS